MQPNLLNCISSQDGISSNTIVENNYRRFQRTALKFGFAISVGTASILLCGQTNQAFGLEPVDANSLDNGTSEYLNNSKGERITKAILREKADVEKLVGGNTPIPQSFAETNRTNVAKQNSINSSLISEIESLRQQYRVQKTRSQQTNPGSIYSNNPIPIAVPRYNQNPTPISIPVTVPITSSKDTQLMISSVEKNQVITPIPLGQYPRGTRVSPNLPNLPPLAAVDRYLPQPIDENTAPPVLPGATNTAYIWPTKGVLTSGYGMRWGRMHRGIDIANKIGTPILAAASGVVEFEGRKHGYGNLVDIRHIDGSLTRYAHNHRHFVRVGQKVQQGEMIAHMGNTGFSTGPHLHFEIRPSGKGAVNPISYLPPRI